MNRDLHAYRKSYEQGELLLENSAKDPFEQFATWFKEVEAAGGVAEPNAMTVATLGTDGFPKSRIVLLKEYDTEGFVFYTNYTSEKGQSIAQHPKVGLSFFWPPPFRGGPTFCPPPPPNPPTPLLRNEHSLSYLSMCGCHISCL